MDTELQIGIMALIADNQNITKMFRIMLGINSFLVILIIFMYCTYASGTPIEKEFRCRIKNGRINCS